MDKQFFDKVVFLRCFLSDEYNKHYSISRVAPRYKFCLRDMMRITGKETAMDFIVSVQDLMQNKMIVEPEIEIEDTDNGNVFKIEPEKAFVNDKIFMMKGTQMVFFTNGGGK